MNLLIDLGIEEFDDKLPVVIAESMIATHNKSIKYNIYDYLFLDVVEAVKTGKLKKQSCGIGRKMVVFPEGNIHACQALENLTEIKLGHIDDNVKISTHIQSYISRFNNPICKKCPAISFCGAGCKVSAYNRTKSINGIDYNFCIWMKYIFDKYFSPGNYV
ncbi:MAG: SPASM domain-containing protein [Deltaproteobacteria bacterium]|jgi:radical SAM protein with 4Fe4S-binding SPASM domain|nr:SPASM domain-containing protein [Deltaproteobacteria bacterium]